MCSRSWMLRCRTRDVSGVRRHGAGASVWRAVPWAVGVAGVLIGIGGFLLAPFEFIAPGESSRACGGERRQRCVGRE